ncbi:hypothetical protein GTK63_00695 [Lactobacillus crispatus]|uniref:EpsG family protein n=1 Tax=Lactobacillus crispatus TaxID=47770 RepID=A0A7X4HLL4_9LACO|nr:EpsG family protein [Lactobacillus crispatus]MYN52860.1 hypothetical protein [Lactobacillus crispatus]
MIVYILTISISTLLLYCGNEIKKNKILKRLLILSAILIPALVAGGRANVVGTDIRSYAEPLQNFANLNNNFTDFLNFQGFLSNGQPFQRFEKGYVSLVYFASRVTPKIWFDFFITEFIILSCVVLGMFKFSKIRNISLGIGVFIFFTFFYNLSFNLIRQSLAMFILFYGFSYLVNKDWLKYILTIFIAFLFHSSAIIGFLFLFIYWALNMDTKKQFYFKLNNDHVVSAQTTRALLICIVVIITVFFPAIIKEILTTLGLRQYVAYLPSTIHGSWIELLIRLPFLAILLLEWKDNSKNELKYFYLVIVVLDICLSQLSGNDSTTTVFGSRIAWYTSVFYIYIMSDMLNVKKNSKSVLLKVILVIYLCLYWYTFTVVLNYNETVPYIFNGFHY